MLNQPLPSFNKRSGSEVIKMHLLIALKTHLLFGYHLAGSVGIEVVMQPFI